MLDGYKKHINGIIEKLDKKQFNYSDEYSGKYNDYGELTNYISYLRLGFICGAVGRYPESILDVGYGNGSFLKCCSERISNCYGFDVSPYPVPGNCQKVQSIIDRYYDVVTFFDSLEHIEDISIVSKLDCSYVCISIPWCHNYSDDWLKNWKHLRPEEHFWHFDKFSLISFMESCGFSYMCGLDLEDIIRKADEKNNILTCIFKKS